MGRSAQANRRRAPPQESSSGSEESDPGSAGPASSDGEEDVRMAGPRGRPARHDEEEDEEDPEVARMHARMQAAMESSDDDVEGSDDDGADDEDGGGDEDDDEGDDDDDTESEGAPEEYGAGPRAAGSESASSEDEEAELQAQLAELPMAMRVKLASDGSALGKPAAGSVRGRGRSAKDMARESKNAPMEMSSKRPVGRFREVLQVSSKPRGRDPRFEELSGGTYKDEVFKKRYAFIFNETLPAERAQLAAQIKKEKNTERRDELQAQLTRVQQALKQEKDRRWKADFEAGLKKKEKDAVAAGKAPYFMKKSEKRKLELYEKYKALQAEGRVDKFLAKKRKKNSAKDHRLLPTERR